MVLRRARVGVREMAARTVVRALASGGFSLKRSSELTRLADTLGSDKGTRKAAHHYTRIYEPLFAPMRQGRLTLLEIGVGADNAASLRMWRRYFPNARLFGFDIEDFTGLTIEGCEIVRGDMASASDLARLAEAIGGPIDIVIDDGSHVSHHQQIALGALFPRVRPQGLYIIEDLHWQPPGLECGTVKTRDLLRRFQADGRIESAVLATAQAEYLAANIAEARLYDSTTASPYDARDALAVLVKK